jgi:hypothetical protein
VRLFLALAFFLATVVPAQADIVTGVEDYQLYGLVIGACGDMTGYGSPVEFCAGQYWSNGDPPVVHLTWHIYCWEDSATERISEWLTVQFIDHRLTIEEQDRLDDILFTMADECPRSSM